MSKKVIDARVMAIRGRSKGDWHTAVHNQQCELGGGVTNSLTSVAKDNYVVEFYEEGIEDGMSRRSENIAFKLMPNGNIRAYQADKPDKAGVSELQFTNPENVSPTVITGNTIKVIEESIVIENNMTDKNTIEMPSELKGKKFRIRKLIPRECFRLMGVDDSDIDKIQAAGVSNSGQYKLAGNSIVVDVLFHIFRKMFVETEPDNDGKPTQLSLF